jgi:hypothetical protein
VFDYNQRPGGDLLSKRPAQGPLNPQRKPRDQLTEALMNVNQGQVQHPMQGLAMMAQAYAKQNPGALGGLF